MNLPFKSFLLTLTFFTGCSDCEPVLPNEPKENQQSIKEVIAEVFPGGNVFAAAHRRFYGTIILAR